MRNKLSVTAVQQKLLEAGEYRKVHFDRMKRNARMHSIGSLGNPSTQITNIKQVKMPPDAKRESGTHEPFMLQAEMAGTYVDKMGRGIFERSDDSGAPTSAPPVTRMKPNQKPAQNKVTADMTKGSRKSESSNSQLWPAAEMASHYVDALPRGNIFSDDNSSGGDRLSGGVKAPSAKNLHGTTRPKSSQKSADLDRHPVKDQPAVAEPTDSFPMPKDAPPKKRTYEHVKSGVLVRVNESVKAKFDIVSTKVLKRLEESYKRFGYRVMFEASGQTPAWKTDTTFLRLIRETVAAKHNESKAFEKRLKEAAWNRLYQLCRNDYNSMYESKEEFFHTIKGGLEKIIESAVNGYRNNLNLFIGQARLISESTMSDVEIVTEAVDHQMALRLIRNKLYEQFGLDAQIKVVFIDGTKYLPEQIQEWVPQLKEEQWMQKAFAHNKGGLHRALGVPQGQKIPGAKLKSATHSGDAHVRHMAQAAHNANE